MLSQGEAYTDTQECGTVFPLETEFPIFLFFFPSFLIEAVTKSVKLQCDLFTYKLRGQRASFHALVFFSNKQMEPFCGSPGRQKCGCFP